MASGADRRIHFALAGLESGILAVCAMLVWLGAASLFYRHSFWTSANLMASNLYGESALARGFGMKTIAGLALYFLLYSALGAVFGLAVGDHHIPRFRVVLIGILSAIAWYYFAYGWMWKGLNPLMTLYTHDRPMFMGHVIYGGLLGRFPRYLEGLSGETMPPPAAGS